MTKRKLTPKQSRIVVSLASWGACFTLPYNYGFMSDYGFVRCPSAAESNAYYESLCAELCACHAQILDAATNARYADVERLANHAQYLNGQIGDRAEDAENLVTFTESGIATASRLMATEASA